MMVRRERMVALHCIVQLGMLLAIVWKWRFFLGADEMYHRHAIVDSFFPSLLRNAEVIRWAYLISVFAELAKIKDSYNCDALSIAAATAAMGCQEWLADVISKMNATRERMAGRLEEMGFNVTPSHANFVWCQHPDVKRSGADHQGIYEFLKANQILVRYMQFPDWGDGLRISVGTDEQIDACLMMIERYLNQ